MLLIVQCSYMKNKNTSQIWATLSELVTTGINPKINKLFELGW